MAQVDWIEAKVEIPGITPGGTERILKWFDVVLAEQGTNYLQHMTQ